MGFCSLENVATLIADGDLGWGPLLVASVHLAAYVLVPLFIYVNEHLVTPRIGTAGSCVLTTALLSLSYLLFFDYAGPASIGVIECES